MAVVRVCFVCLGNICRSPTAAGVMRHRVHRAGLSDHVEVESAGTAAYHVGELPDERARAEARRRGVDIDDTAQRFGPADLERFDVVLAMDASNLADLRAMARSDDQLGRIRLLRDFDADADPGAEVPDPYYGEGDGFADVFDLVDAACDGLLAHLVDHHDLR